MTGTSDVDFNQNLEIYAQAFTFSEAGGASISLKGPDHPDNPERDSTEPYFWEPDNLDDLIAWITNLGDGEVTFTLDDGAAPQGVTGSARTLLVQATISRPSGVVGAPPGDVIGLAQTLTVQATLGQPAKVLLLSDFDTTGLAADALGLIVAGSPPIVFGRAPRTAGGSLIDGELSISDTDEPINWIRFRDAGSNAGSERISLNDNGLLDLNTYFGADGDGNDLTLHIQTTTGSVDFPIEGNIVESGIHYVILSIPAAIQSFIAGISEGDRFIFALTRTVIVPPGVTGSAQTLTVQATISRPSGVVTAPTGVTGSAQTLSVQATISRPSGVVTAPPGELLVLSDFDATGLDVDALALIEAGSPPIVFGRAPRTAGGDLLDGELGLSDTDEPINWIRFRDAGSNAGSERISLNDNGLLDLNTYFGADGDGNDLTLHIQTAAGSVEFPIEGNIVESGIHYVILSIPADSQSFIAGISDGDRFIFALTRMVTVPTGVTGSAQTLTVQATISRPSGVVTAPPGVTGSAQTLAVQATISRPAGVVTLAGDIRGSAQTLTVQATISRPSGVVTAPPGVIGSARTLSVQVTISRPSGVVTAPVVDVTGSAQTLTVRATISRPTGRVDLPGDAAPMPMVGWAANFVGTPYRYWSGEGELTLGGHAYEGRSFINISAYETSLDAPDVRLTASFAVADTADREPFLQDPGPLPVEIEWIHSSDGGHTWIALPRKFVGRLSQPTLHEGVYSIEIETYSGDVARGHPKRWSDEDQQRRYPGDRFFEYTRQLFHGVETRGPL